MKNKEFIKRLKEDIILSDQAELDIDYQRERIDKLAGNKLI